MERRKLLAKKELNLLSGEEKEQLNLIEEDFEKVATEISKVAGESKELNKDYLDKLLDSGFAADMLEAKDILVNGPKIKGFEETEDVKIPNKKVSEFLEDAFTKPILRKCFIAAIKKDDKWLIKGTGAKDINKMNELLHKFNVDLHGTDILITPNKEEYLRVAMHLENVNDPNELKHLYKLRGTAGYEGGFAKMDLHSFGVEKPSNFDYLEEQELLTSEEQKMQAYILGGIGHEVVHRMKFHFPKETVKFDGYKEIAQEEFLDITRILSPIM